MTWQVINRVSGIAPAEVLLDRVLECRHVVWCGEVFDSVCRRMKTYSPSKNDQVSGN